jgi:site-specific recombinase XerD
MAAILAGFPSPAEWTQEHRDQAVKFAALLDVAQQVIAAKNIAGVDYTAEKLAFLEKAEKKSVHTKNAYKAGLERLDMWALRNGVNILEAGAIEADAFVNSLKGSASSVRLDVAACSSFFTFLHRRHSAIKNPFRGTTERPAKKAVCEDIAIPKSQEEIECILAELPAREAAAVSLLAYRGLRVGGLNSFTVIGDRFSCFSKGKIYKGIIPAVCLDAIKKAELPHKNPFTEIKVNTLQRRVARTVKKLKDSGKIAACYSCHDLRHFYAITEFRKDKDIHRVKKLLNHTSVGVTEVYLKGLGEEE